MDDHEQQDGTTRLSDDPETAEQVRAEQEWCAEAGLSRVDWQRLVFARWRYREGHLTEYPDAR